MFRQRIVEPMPLRIEGQVLSDSVAILGSAARDAVDVVVVCVRVWGPNGIG